MSVFFFIFLLNQLLKLISYYPSGYVNTVGVQPFTS